jgi:hypothetical protein
VFGACARFRRFVDSFRDDSIRRAVSGSSVTVSFGCAFKMFLKSGWGVSLLRFQVFTYLLSRTEDR